MAWMILKWSTFKIISSDPDLHPRWPPSADRSILEKIVRRLYCTLLYRLYDVLYVIILLYSILYWCCLQLRKKKKKKIEAQVSLYRSLDKVLLRMSACRIHLSYYSNPILPYGSMLKLCLLMAAILDGGRGHRTQFWKYTTQEPSMPCLL